MGRRIRGVKQLEPAKQIQKALNRRLFDIFSGHETVVPFTLHLCLFLIYLICYFQKNFLSDKVSEKMFNLESVHDRISCLNLSI